MLLDVVYERLKENGIQDYVFEADIVDYLPFRNEVVHTIRDVRSATFYACGLAQQHDTSVALFVRKEYLPSTHTGLMEAWFQNRHIIVIAFGADILNDDLNYFRTCTYSRLKIQTNADVLRYIPNKQMTSLPELYLVEEDLDFEKPFNYKCLIDLRNLPLIPDKLFVYERISGLFKEHPSIVNISQRDKYGTISKYMGFCVASPKSNMLVIDDSLILLDVNIFNNRYIDGKFKILVIGDMKQSNVLKWLDANHITFFEESDLARAICRLMERRTPTIAFVPCPVVREDLAED